MRVLWLLVCLSIGAGSASAQRLDPDWCWTCRDSFQHFAAGAGIDVASRVAAMHAWQRVAIASAIGAAYELGQADNAERTGPGYGFGPKDLILDVAGAVVAEVAWSVARKLLH